jgi:hypothetical protein
MKSALIWTHGAHCKCETCDTSNTSDRVLVFEGEERAEIHMPNKSEAVKLFDQDGHCWILVGIGAI